VVAACCLRQVCEAAALGDDDVRAIAAGKLLVLRCCFVVQLLVQILVVVANIQMRTLKTEVAKGSM